MRGSLIRLLAPLIVVVGLGACASNGVQPGIVYSSGAPQQGAYGGGPSGSGPYGGGQYGGTYNSGGYVRQGFAAVDDPLASPGVYHPLVVTHPETGRRALYLGRRRNAYVAGLPLSESEALLDELWRHATRDDIAWPHQWQAGDLVLWDNRCTMHRRDAFDPESRRVLHRTQIKGEKPPAA